MHRPHCSTKVNAAKVVAANNDSDSGAENKILIGDTAKSRADLYAKYSSRSTSRERTYTLKMQVYRQQKVLHMSG